MIKSKRMTSKAGITIPKDLRGMVGIFASSAVDLEVKDGGILIKKHTACCDLCGSIECVVRYRGRELCGDCIKEFLKKWEEQNHG